MNKHNRMGLVVGGLLGVAMAAGCVRSRVYVIEAPSAEALVVSSQSIALRQGEHAVAVRADEIAAFEAAIGKAFRKRDKSGDQLVLGSEAEGNGEAAGLQLVYRFVALDDGDVPVRVVSGVAGLFGSPFYALGDGDLGVEAVFVDAHQRPLARVVCSGPISGMFAGRKDGFEAAAKSLAEFAAKHFPSDVSGSPRASRAAARAE